MMNIDKLSLRLETVAKYIPKGHRIADIGSDHAYLPCHLVKKGTVPFAIAGEVVEGPYRSALRQVKMEGLENLISVRKGDGLEVLNSGEVDSVTIAGMGGALITSILDKGEERLHGVKRLIMQPNLAARPIRDWLLLHDWELVNEEILEEDGKIYEVLVAERGVAQKPYENIDRESALLLGPFLLQEKTEPFQKKWNQELRNWKNILDNLESAADTEENKKKRQELERKIALVEEVLSA